MFIKAIVGLALFLVIDLITKNMLISCVSVVIVNIVFILLYDVKNIKQVKITSSKFTKAAMINLFKIGFFTFALTFLGN